MLKNKEIAKYIEKLKAETDEVLRKNADNIRLIEKEYEELRNVTKQQTSLPEDIEALKVFHAAYLQKELELEQERKKREELQRELASKDAIDKVFAEKSFKRLTGEPLLMGKTRGTFGREWQNK